VRRNSKEPAWGVSQAGFLLGGEILWGLGGTVKKALLLAGCLAVMAEPGGGR